MSIDEQERRLRQKLREMQSAFSEELEERVEKLAFDDVVEWEDGKTRLKKKRAEGLKKELAALEDAEQYVLLARVDGLYPCKRCPRGVVFLKRGEVWRYGVTRKGQKGRYTKEFLRLIQLEFVPMFSGALQACLAQEKVMIYNYPLLPENFSRSKENRLVYPPGNLRTD